MVNQSASKGNGSPTRHRRRAHRRGTARWYRRRRRGSPKIIRRRGRIIGITLAHTEQVASDVGGVLEAVDAELFDFKDAAGLVVVLASGIPDVAVWIRDVYYDIIG